MSANTTRSLLWTTLAVSAGANSITSFTTDSTLLHLILGTVSLLCICGLVAGYVRARA